MRPGLLMTLLLGCAGPADPPADDTDAEVLVDEIVYDLWDRRLPATTALAPVRGHTLRRAVFHLHSPYSHDACDGRGYEDGVLDTDCLADLRLALCDTRFDAAFVTDHPDHGDAQPFEALFHHEDGDTLVPEGEGISANEIPCEDGHVVRWRAGFEDDLMPVGLRRHVDPDQTTRHALLNASDAEAIGAMRDAGAHVLIAHTESRDVATLSVQQDAGLHGVEAYNLHAMFAPDIRGEFLGLEPLGFITDIGPYTAADTELEPDLMFLAVHGEQRVTLDTWDALLARGPMMGTGGTDAHQNVLAFDLADGERADSYRRMLRWFSTMLIANGEDLAAIDEALAARRAFVAFEALGTPEGFDVHLDAAGTIHEMGSDAAPGELVVTCPTLSVRSPQGRDAPEIAVRVMKDGEVWQQDCGTWAVDSGVYRVEVDIVPHHLRPFLGADADTRIKAYPWIYSGAVRVVL